MSRASRADIGGAGAGTAMAGGGLQVGADTTAGKIMLLASPAASMVAGYLITLARMEFDRFVENREVAKARKTVEQAIDDPRYSDAERAEFREVLRNLDRAQLSRQLRRVRAVGVLPEASSGQDPL